LLERDRATLHEQLAKTLVTTFVLHRHRFFERAARDGAGLHEHVAQTIAAIHHPRVADAAFVEIDVAEVVPVRDSETACLLAHRQELQHVRKTGLFEASLDRHQRTVALRVLIADPRSAARRDRSTATPPSRDRERTDRLPRGTPPRARDRHRRARARRELNRSCTRPPP